MKKMRWGKKQDKNKNSVTVSETWVGGTGEKEDSLFDNVGSIQTER